jgi:hypothetical protein
MVGAAELGYPVQFAQVCNIIADFSQGETLGAGSLIFLKMAFLFLT